MSQQSSRRALLRTTGAVMAAGLAGCALRRAETETATASEGDGTATESPSTDGTPTPGTTYGIEVQNRLEAEDFDTVSGLSDPQPAVVHLRVSNLDPNDEKTFFEETVEVATGESTEFPAAFTVRPNGPTYAMSAQLESFVEGGLSRQEYMRDGFTFTPGSDRAPSVNPIPVKVYDIPMEDVEVLIPGIGIRPEQ